MSDVAIWVEGFSTRYCIGPRERDKARRDVITDAFASVFLFVVSVKIRNSQSAIARASVPYYTGHRHSQSLSAVPRFTVSARGSRRSVQIRTSNFAIRT